jgi:NAD(P)-dependent dehydrogenase (short-subunit alcohol dehydrogenase family)
VSELRFDGRVAVVTGAGRGLGRAYAHLLAARGARVVVNDSGGDRSGRGIDAEPASSVAAEIAAAGGEAVAEIRSVASEADAQALVDRAIHSFGRIDAVIANAGILTVDEFATVPLERFEEHLRVHTLGSLNVMRAAWPHFVRQSYGRVAVTVSAALLGSAGNVPYAVAKAGLIGLMRGAAEAGRLHGIAVNAIAPSAYTRMAGDPELRRLAGIPPLEGKEGRGRPEEVAPLAAFLAHEDCPVTGEILVSTGSNVARWFIATTRGYTEAGMTPEAIRDHWDAICDETGFEVPRNAAESQKIRSRFSA